MIASSKLAKGIALSAVAAVALGLSACSGGASADGGDKTLTVMFWGDNTAKAKWEKIATAFQADGHQDVKFKYITQPDEYETKLQTLIAAGQEPDVFMLNTDYTKQFYEAGATLDLAPQLDKLGVDLDQEFLPQSVWREGDAVVGLSPVVHAVVMYYNKAAFDAAGVAYPPTDAANAWTWDQFAEASKKLSSGSGSDQKWGSFITYSAIPWTPLVASNGGSWFDEDGSQFALDSPQAEKVFSSIKGLVDDGAVVPPDAITSIGWDILLQSKRAAMMLDGTWNTQFVMDAWGDDAGIAVLPAFDTFSSMSITDQIVAGSATKNPELAAEFVHFAAQAQNNPDAFLSLPASIAYSQGADKGTWLNSSPRPEGFEQVITDSVSKSVRLPGAQTSAFPKISSIVPVTLTKYFSGEITDLNAALTADAPGVNQALAGGK